MTFLKPPDGGGAAPGPRTRSATSAVASTAALFVLVAATAAAEPPGPRHFGFAGGCDSERALQETAQFTNVCTIDIDDPRLLDDRWVAKMAVRGLKLIVAAHHILFEPVGDPVGGRQLYDLRPDHLSRWRAAVAGREDALRALAVHVFIADEPSWNGISRSELAAANDAVSETCPWATTATSFSHRLEADWFDGRDVPTDAVGYHHYQVLDPRTDPLYQSNLDLIRSRSRGRSLVYVMDAWWSPVHGDEGLDPEDMAEVARNYEALVTADPGAAGLIGFHWDGPAGAMGARDLPESAVWEYRRIGSEITGKCLAPPGVRPDHALFLLGCEYFATLRYRSADGPRFAVAMPRERDYGTWVLDEGDVIGGLKLVAEVPPVVFASLHTDLPATIRVYETATGRLVWPVRDLSSPDR